jgi:predicted ester cyclase
MTIEANKAIVRRIYAEAESQGEYTVIDECYREDFDDPRHPERGTGPAGVKAHIARMREAFPDLVVTIDDLIAEGDTVVARVTSHGTHQHEFGGVAPQGKQVIWTGTVTRRFARGKVVQQWQNFDTLGLLRQLGAFPAGSKAIADP